MTTTTPLPPLPKEFGCTNGLWAYYTADQMQSYATKARADLEAENQRLRALLEEISRANAAQVAPVYSELARAALKGSNHD